MKRNKSSTRAMRHRTTLQTKKSGTSRYALKVKAGKQMYGDGKVCCGHRIRIAGVPQPQAHV
jgi:hypothetical protein